MIKIVVFDRCWSNRYRDKKTYYCKEFTISMDTFFVSYQVYEINLFGVSGRLESIIHVKSTDCVLVKQVKDKM